MRRPPGFWILLSTGVLWLSLQDVHGLRATSLIFAKTTTTTTTESTNSSLSGEEVVTETEVGKANVTRANFTGNPQIDYLYDPNLPQELNGYNLSDYPFYSRVPEDINFKCDGLHDGFYAGIKYKCQVYHHCLYETRYDFLCANYTAFDQKTFICQFVSEVDCKNSKNFWHRNDALYQTPTTTTLKPQIVYTPPSKPHPILGNQDAGQRAGGKRRRPPARRPQYDYYEDEYDDDYYEDRPRSRRRRPRPRPRPVYDDEEYEEYEDDRYERRNRRPYDRRGSDRRRNKNRSKPKDVDRPLEKDRFNESEEEERRNHDEDDKRSTNRRVVGERHNDNDGRRERPRKGSRIPLNDDEEDEQERNEEKRKVKPTSKNNDEEKRTENDNENKAMIKPTSGSSIYDRPRVAPRIKPPVPKNEADKYAYHKPINSKTATISGDDDYYDDYDEPAPKQIKSNHRRPSSSDSIRPLKSSTQERNDNRNRNKHPVRERNSSPSDRNENEDTEVNESPRNRFQNDEAVDEEIRVAHKPRIQFNKRPSRTKIDDESPPRETDQPSTTHKPDRSEYSRKPYSKHVKTESTTKETIIIENNSNANKPSDEEYYDDYEEIKESDTNKQDIHPSSSTNKSKTKLDSAIRYASTSTTTTTSLLNENPKDKSEQTVRIVKRPFLPSRGGNPFSARGLQPVGFMSLDKKIEMMEQQGSDDFQQKSNIKESKDSSPQFIYSSKLKSENEQQIDVHIPDTKIIFRPSPIMVKTPQRSRYNIQPSAGGEEEFEPISNPQHTKYKINEYNGPRTTQKPKIPDHNPLDITENEYDVTLNDALNPTIPNLPVRSFPTGFSASNDYTYSAFQRPRYVLEPLVSSANSDYVYQPKTKVRQRFETVPQNYNTQDRYVSANSDYKTHYITVPEGNQSPNYRNRVSQAETQAYFSRY